jgi:hypothetical protein
MEESEKSEQKLWTPTILLLTMIMVGFLLVTIYNGYILNLLWASGLGFIWGATSAASYYFSSQRKQTFRLIYILQAVIGLGVILAFVYFQAILGPNPFLLDILVMAFSAVFAGGMLGIPAYKYAKIKTETTAESQT